MFNREARIEMFVSPEKYWGETCAALGLPAPGRDFTNSARDRQAALARAITNDPFTRQDSRDKAALDQMLANVDGAVAGLGNAMKGGAGR